MHIAMWKLCLILMIHVIEESTSCSLFCSCKWKNGKQTVECENKSLTEIPDGLDPETQVLEFRGNNLNKLTKELFVKKQLSNLQRLFLSYCKIKNIHKDTFKGLTNLVEMDLSNNLLEGIPSGAFLGCPSLMKLTLSSNPISSLKKFSFSHLSYLNTLELSNCQISDIEPTAFQGLHSLEWLSLKGNRLTAIRGRETLPENIRGVELEQNSWNCDCRIQDLYAWLRSFTVPLSEEPVCNKPARLRGRAIKSIPQTDFACLPDITPTTFYLELGEGKNVSLLCHVHAAPEATVSWSFQGQALQNNSAVSPGFHLVYYVEEGTENKRSELFIYNANAEDNGTYICTAENAAGTVQSNFTIRIVVKEDPVVITVSFPFEYVYVVIGIFILGVIIVVITTVSILRCRRRRNRQQKREQTKEITLQFQQNSNKCTVPTDNIENVQNPLKITTTADDVGFYGVRPCENVLPPLIMGTATDQATSPMSINRFNLEQNPDVINGTESIVGRRDGDGEDVRLISGFEIEDLNGVQVPIACLRSTELYADMRCVINPESYPIDYCLPRIACRSQCSDAYYRTLPSNRAKRHSAANPIKRYSREVEFLSRSVDTPYDNFHSDIRYTADGYPARQEVASMPPIVAMSHDVPTSEIVPCCSPKWPSSVQANLHANTNTGQLKTSVNKRCVGAQTGTEEEPDKGDNPAGNKSESPPIIEENGAVNGSLTESPDEGYVGEPSAV